MSNDKRPKATVVPRSPEVVMTEEQLVEFRRRKIEEIKAAAHLDPFGDQEVPIPLRERGWKVKEANDYADENRHYQMRHKFKYEPVTAADLPDGVTPESVGYRLGEDGQLCRGPRGTEKLWKMPDEAYDYRQQLKTEKNKKGMGSAKAMKEDAANAAANTFGAQAGDFVSRLHIRGEDREGPLGS